MDVNPGHLKVNNVAGGVAKDTVIGYGSLGGAFQINFYEDDQFLTALANQAFLGQTVYTSVDFTQECWKIVQPYRINFILYNIF